MARGDVRWFNRALFDALRGLHNLQLGVLKVGLVTDAMVPTVDSPDPRWGAGGTIDFSAHQVALGAGYSGPPLLAGAVLLQVDNVATLRALTLTIPQDPAGFQDAAFGIVFDDANSAKRAIAFVDLDGPLGNRAEPLELDWVGATNDLLTLAATP